MNMNTAKKKNRQKRVEHEAIRIYVFELRAV